LLLLWLLWAHLRSSTLSGSKLDLLDDFSSAVGSIGELVLNLGLLVVDVLLLLRLEAFNFLLMFLVVSLGSLLRVLLGGGSASHLVFDLGLRIVKLILALLDLALDDLLHLLIVSLALLLDGAELLDEALLSVGVPLGKFALSFLLSFLLGGLAFSDELHLLVVIFGLLLNVG